MVFKPTKGRQVAGLASAVIFMIGGYQTSFITAATVVD